jgi:hypothetical protein
VSTIAHPPRWPADPGHRDAIDTLLTMAESAQRWGEPGRAVTLLDNVEQIVGALPGPYEQLRWRCLLGREASRLG